MLFGAKFAQSGVILQIAAPFSVMQVISGLDFIFLSALGYAKERFHILLWTLGGSALANIILVPLIGTTGAVVSIGIGWIIMHVMAVRIVARYEPIIWEWVILVRGFVVTAVFMAVVWWVRGIVFSGMRLHDLVVILALGVAYIAVLGLANIDIVRTLAREIRAVIGQRK